jgi:hypothetical protein
MLFQAFSPPLRPQSIQANNKSTTPQKIEGEWDFTFRAGEYDVKETLDSVDQALFSRKSPYDNVLSVGNSAALLNLDRIPIEMHSMVDRLNYFSSDEARSSNLTRLLPSSPI